MFQRGMHLRVQTSVLLVVVCGYEGRGARVESAGDTLLRKGQLFTRLAQYWTDILLCHSAENPARFTPLLQT
jgi:hypothetical protein